MEKLIQLIYHIQDKDNQEEDLMEHTKPPLGIMPQWLWRQQRLRELIAAIERRINDWTANPDKLIEKLLDESLEHTKWLNDYYGSKCTAQESKLPFGMSAKVTGAPISPKTCKEFKT